MEQKTVLSSATGQMKRDILNYGVSGRALIVALKLMAPREPRSFGAALLWWFECVRMASER